MTSPTHVALLPPRTRLEAYRAWWVGVPLAIAPFAFVFGPVMGGLVAGELVAFTLAVGVELSRPFFKKPPRDRALAIGVLAAALAPVVALVAFLIAAENPRVKIWVEEGDVSVVFVAGYALEIVVALVSLWVIFKRRGAPLDYQWYRAAVISAGPLVFLAAGAGEGVQTLIATALGLAAAGFLLLGWMRIFRPRQAVKFDPIFGPAPSTPTDERPVFRAFRSR